MKKKRLKGIGLAATAGLLIALTGPAAFADNVQQDVVAGGNGTVTAGGSTTIKYRITANSGDGQTGCNAADGSAATVTINVPAGVSVSPSALTFTSCGTEKTASFSSTIPGNYSITAGVADNGVGTYNTNPATFTLQVLPAANTAPQVSVTGVADGASYEFGAVPAAGCSVTDAEDGPSTPEAQLSAITGPLDSYGLGSQTATCSYTDAGGLTATAAATYSIVDTTNPVITFKSTSPAANSHGWNNSPVTVMWTCSDAVGVVSATVSDTLDSEGANQTASGICEDVAGNTASDQVSGISIDLTDPEVQWDSLIDDGDVFIFGYVPDEPTCSATDELSGPDGCTVTGYGTAVGTHTLTATALDYAGNDTVETRTYTVDPWMLKGFYQPVDMNGAWNMVKGGSTVPLKFEVLAGTTELADVTAVQSFTVKGVACPASTAVTDDIELTTTGGTTLRYDATGGQFVQNWQTPKKAGACYTVTMQTLDGSKLSANFKLK